MKLSDGKTLLTIDTGVGRGYGIVFEGDEATVPWWLGDDDTEDDAPSLATFRWRDAGSITLTGGGYGRCYDIDFVRHTGREPSREVLAHLEDAVLDAIPSHYKQLESTR